MARGVFSTSPASRHRAYGPRHRRHQRFPRWYGLPSACSIPSPTPSSCAHDGFRDPRDRPVDLRPHQRPAMTSPPLKPLPGIGGIAVTICLTFFAFHRSRLVRVHGERLRPSTSSATRRRFPSASCFASPSRSACSRNSTCGVAARRHLQRAHSHPELDHTSSCSAPVLFKLVKEDREPRTASSSTKTGWGGAFPPVSPVHERAMQASSPAFSFQAGGAAFFPAQRAFPRRKTENMSKPILIPCQRSYAR